jgi:hypothetical protein
MSFLINGIKSMLPADMGKSVRDAAAGCTNLAKKTAFVGVALGLAYAGYQGGHEIGSAIESNALSARTLAIGVVGGAVASKVAQKLGLNEYDQGGIGLIAGALSIYSVQRPDEGSISISGMISMGLNAGVVALSHFGLSGEDNYIRQGLVIGAYASAIGALAGPIVATAANVALVAAGSLVVGGVSAIGTEYLTSKGILKLAAGVLAAAASIAFIPVPVIAGMIGSGVVLGAGAAIEHELSNANRPAIIEQVQERAPGGPPFIPEFEAADPVEDLPENTQEEMEVAEEGLVLVGAPGGPNFHIPVAIEPPMFGDQLEGVVVDENLAAEGQ